MLPKTVVVLMAMIQLGKMGAKLQKTQRQTSADRCRYDADMSFAGRLKLFSFIIAINMSRVVSDHFSVTFITTFISMTYCAAIFLPFQLYYCVLFC